MVRGSLSRRFYVGVGCEQHPPAGRCRLLEQGAVVSSSWDGSPIDGGNVLIRCRRNLAENAIRPVALGRNYEQSGIRQSLIRAERDFRRLALDMADGATSPVSALC